MDGFYLAMDVEHGETPLHGEYRDIMVLARHIAAGIISPTRVMRIDIAHAVIYEASDNIAELALKMWAEVQDEDGIVDRRIPKFVEDNAAQGLIERICGDRLREIRAEADYRREVSCPRQTGRI